MFKKFSDSIQTLFREETLAERSERILPGAVYGAISATLYVWILSTINVLTLPGLPLAVDWGRLLTFWFGLGLGLALSGVIAGWFTETYMSIAGGGVVITVLLLVGNLIVSLFSTGSPQGTVETIVASLSLIGAGVLLAGTLRMAINRHIHILKFEPPEQHRKQLARLMGLVLIMGMLPGLLARFDLPAQAAIRSLNDNLQMVATDPSYEVRFPLAMLPALKDHFGMDYNLYARSSTSTTGALDITIRFSDRYTITCLMPTAAGYNTFITLCNEGKTITLP